MADLDLLLANIDRAYDRKSWHGTNLKGSIRGMSLDDAVWRPAPGRHNIFELTLHAAYWKHAVWRRITGGERGTFPLSGSNWFQVDDATPEGWNNAKKLLESEHRHLRQAIASMKPKALAAVPKGARVSNLETILGVAAHDLYHAGQIQLLKRLRAEATSR